MPSQNGRDRGSQVWHSRLWWRMPLVGMVLAVPSIGPASLFVAVYGSPTYGGFWMLFFGSFCVATGSVAVGALLVGVPFELLLIRPRTLMLRQTALARCLAYALWGTVGSQTTFSFGTPEDIRHEVEQRITTLGRAGLVLCPAYDVDEPDIPWANIAAFLEAVRHYG